jgi:hypothetical protein
MAVGTTIATNKGVIENSCNIVGMFNQNSIEFVFDHTGNSNTTAEVVVGSHHFEAMKIETIDANNDRYYLDLSDILSKVAPLAPLTVATTNLLTTVVITCNGLSSIGAVLGTSASETILLCYGIKGIGESAVFENLLEFGSGSAIYHNGKICIYYSGISGTVSLTINTISRNYTLVNGFNIIQLHSSQLITGSLDGTYTQINLYYRPEITDGSTISWIDKDGKWSFWKFRQLAEETDSKWSGEINNYGKRNTDILSKSRMLNNDSSIQISYDTVAMDEAHYQKLVDIARSPSIIVGTYPMKFISASKRVTCRQNLNFKLTLEQDLYAVSY